MRAHGITEIRASVRSRLFSCVELNGTRLFTTTSARLSSGFGGAEQPRGGVSGAGAPAGGARDGRGGDDPRSDGSVRAAGGGALHPGQHSPLR